MKKNKNNSINNDSELDEMDKRLFHLASKKEETPERIKEKIRKTIEELSKQ